MTNLSIPEHVFISYSHLDEKFAKRLVNDLQKAGIRVWIDTKNQEPGTPNWDKMIREAIQRSLVILLLASPHAAQSDTVLGELQVAKRYNCPIYPIWIAGKWEDSVPLDMVKSQHIDCRKAHYETGLVQITETIAKEFEIRIPKHFLIADKSAEAYENYYPVLIGEESLYIIPDKSSSGNDSVDNLQEQETGTKVYVLPREYLATAFKKKIVAVRPYSYMSLQALLDDLYINYLQDYFSPFSYGKDWIITSRYGRLVVPWEWLAEGDFHKPVFISTPSWQNDIPENYGLVGQTTWMIMDKFPIDAYGLATNDTYIARIALYLSRMGFQWKMTMFLDDLLDIILKHEKEKTEDAEYLTVTTPDKINQDDFKYLLIFKARYDGLKGKAFIPGPKWKKEFDDSSKIDKNRRRWGPNGLYIIPLEEL